VKTTRSYLWLSGASDGKTNMDKDRGLYEKVETGWEGFVLRLYRWKPAALSLGANQELESVDTSLAEKRSIPVVRRITGGGAILHDDELTYSLVMPRSFLSDTSVPASLELFSRCLKEFYSGLGLSPVLAKDGDIQGTFGMRTSACFAGNEKWDLLIGGRKLGGNAQKRGRKAVFQHGSIPLTLDWPLVCSLTRTFPTPSVPQSLTDALEVLGETLPNSEELERRLAEAFGRVLGCEWINFKEENLG